MTPLSQFLSEVEKRAEKAPNGPYTSRYPYFECPTGSLGTVAATESIVELFMHARTDIPTLVAICRELAGALEFYSRGEHIMRESEPAPCNVCPPIGHHAKRALTRAAALAGKEQGRGE